MHCSPVIVIIRDRISIEHLWQVREPWHSEPRFLSWITLSLKIFEKYLGHLSLAIRFCLPSLDHAFQHMFYPTSDILLSSSKLKCLIHLPAPWSSDPSGVPSRRDANLSSANELFNPRCLLFASLIMHGLVHARISDDAETTLPFVEPRDAPSRNSAANFHGNFSTPRFCWLFNVADFGEAGWKTAGREGRRRFLSLFGSLSRVLANWVEEHRRRLCLYTVIDRCISPLSSWRWSLCLWKKLKQRMINYIRE